MANTEDISPTARHNAASQVPQRDSKLEPRTQAAVEILLENEALTADLDDAAAQVLLDWGLACAEQVVRDTAGLENAKAEMAMASRLRAVRRLMRTVTDWFSVGEYGEADGNAARLAGVLEQAVVIYGESLVPPDCEQRESFLRQELAHTSSPAQAIGSVRTFVESLARGPSSCSGGINGQDES